MIVQDLKIVTKIAEFGSITGAAADLDMLVATASAALKRVEKELGFELFIRSTRKLRLSSAGENYIPKCIEAIRLLDKAKYSEKDNNGEIEGSLRIAISSDLGRNVVVPWLDEFMSIHPKISIKVSLSDSRVDLYRESIDIALRYGSPTDSNLLGFKICDVPRVLCASPTYLDTYGVPKYPDDLLNHNGLFYELHDVVHNQWRFSKGNEQFKIRMKGNRASNDGDLVRRWCVSGRGIATKASIDMADDLLNGRIVTLLQDYQFKPIELWLIYPNKQIFTPAVRLLRDELKNKIMETIIDLEKQGYVNSNNPN